MKRLLSYILFFFLFASCSTGKADDDGNSSSPEGDENGQVTDKNEYSDKELLLKIQKDALTYFWDYAEENSGLARERYDTDDPDRDVNTVTIGGSGFGLMTLLVGVEEG